MLRFLAENYLIILYSITVSFIIYLVIKQRGEPLKTISWLLVIILIPIAGIILYFYFGQNYRRQKIFNRKGLSDFERMRDFSHIQMQHLDKHAALLSEKLQSKTQIMKLLLNNSKAMLTENNQLHIYTSGRDAFDIIISDITNAKSHIHLEYYIIEEDKIGNQIRDLLVSKAKEGVEVRLIYDDLGSWGLGKKFLQPLIAAGVEVHAFLPVRFPYFTNKINYRNHRKIIVVDGNIGHVGGMNIADRYIEGVAELGSWKDMQLRIEGEAAHSLQTIFLIDWYFVTNQAINDDRFFPPCQINEKKIVQ
ncbi:MAG TPA: phospholipase D-like domain-containing protein, partial [Bacteroidales bacterium]